MQISTMKNRVIVCALLNGDNVFSRSSRVHFFGGISVRSNLPRGRMVIWLVGAGGGGGGHTLYREN